MSNGLSAELSALTIAPRAILRSDFSTQDVASGLHLDDGIAGHIEHFAVDDLLRVVGLGFPDPEQSQVGAVIAHKFWLPGALPMAVLCDVWLKVTAVHDNGTHFCYDVEVQYNDGPDCRFPVGAVVTGYGQADSQRILLSAADEEAAYVDIYRTGDTPWDVPLSLVRVGQLDGLSAVEGSQYGIAIGSTLAEPGNLRFIASEKQVHLSQVDLSLSNEHANTVRLGSDGSLRLGTNVDDAGTTGLSYTAGTQALSVAGPFSAAGAGKFAGQVSLTNGDVTTIRLSPNGDIVAGTNVDDAGTTGLSYTAETQALSIAGSFSAGDAGTFAGQVSLTNGDVTTIRLSPNGDIAAGANVDDPAQTLFHLDTAAGRLALTCGLALDGDVAIDGNLTIGDGQQSTGALKQTGEFLLGPNVQADDGVHLHYSPLPGQMAINVPVNLAADLVSTGTVGLESAGKRTIQLDANGSFRVGSDTSVDAQTALAYNTESNSLESRATLYLYGNTESRGALSYYDNGNQTIAIAPDGDVRVGRNVNAGDGTAFHLDPSADHLTLSTELRLSRDTVVGGDLRLQDDAALLAGEGDSVRVDQDGIQLRLEPGENNSIKVFGIGRAALINAYQTADSMQELDVLAYYNPGVPSLHGRLLLGVAGVDDQEPDTFLRMTRYFTGVRNIEMQASYLKIDSEQIRFNGNTDVRGDFDFSGTGGTDRVFRLRNLPISPDGLPAGAVWNDGGTLKIV